MLPSQEMVQYHHYYLQTKRNERRMATVSQRERAIREASAEFVSLNHYRQQRMEESVLQSHSPLPPVIFWLRSPLTKPSTKSEGKETQVCSPFSPSSQGQSRVENPAEDNQHILFTQQRCICDKAQTGCSDNTTSSLLQTRLPVFCRWYLQPLMNNIFSS